MYLMNFQTLNHPSYQLIHSYAPFRKDQMPPAYSVTQRDVSLCMTNFLLEPGGKEGSLSHRVSRTTNPDAVTEGRKAAPPIGRALTNDAK